MSRFGFSRVRTILGACGRSISGLGTIARAVAIKGIAPAQATAVAPAWIASAVPTAVIASAVATAMIATLAATLALAPVVQAQTGDSSTARADIVASRLNCPICEGYTLRDCPLPICAQMREEIRQMLEEGRNEDEIMDHFVALHGPQVLNMPPARGAFLAAWILPLAVLAGGAFAVTRTLLRAGRSDLPHIPGHSPGPGPSRTHAADPATLERVEQLIEERDSQ